MEVLAGLFHYATDTAKCVCYETATTEVSAYINFAESEVEKPADEWDALPLDEKSTWIPDEDTVKFVADRDDWKSVVLWSGWPVLCAGVLDVPVYQPTWKPLKPKGFKITKSKLDKLAKLILDKRFTFVDDVGLQSDLTQHVLDIHQFEPITMGSKLTLSQIVHGLAGMAKNARGDSWAEDIIIQSFTVLERSEYLSLFSSPRVIFIILHDNTHWSLLACLVGHGEIWCYDGAPTRGIREAAYTSCTFLCSALQFDFQLKYAQVPHQKDGWSCGHRCVVHAGYILQFVEAGKFRALPESIPDMVVSQTSFEAVCQLRPQVAPGIPRPPVLEDEGSEQLFLPELVIVPLREMMPRNQVVHRYPLKPLLQSQQTLLNLKFGSSGLVQFHSSLWMIWGPKTVISGTENAEPSFTISVFSMDKVFATKRWRYYQIFS